MTALPCSHTHCMICAGFAGHLAVPANLVKGLLQGDKHVTLLVHAAAANGITSRQALALAWEADPTLLSNELRHCLKRSGQLAVQSVWSRM